MSLMIVLLVGLMVSAGTFAYFQWTTDVNQRTNVNVTIEAGGIKMVMTPEGGVLEAKGLKPVADCMESYAYFDTQIQIQNTTGSLVVPSFKLKARVKPNDAANAGTLKKSDLAHIHYTVVEIDYIGQNIMTDKADDTGARRCYEPSHIQKEGVGRTGLFADTANDGTVATGTFADMSNTLDDNGWTSAINLPSSSSKFLARQYNDDSVKGDIGAFGITFIGDIADSTGIRNTTRYFRVYVWIDSGYTYTNAGTNMADPMQNAIIEVTWSTDSIVQQVTGERLPGLYRLDGSYVSWEQLKTNGDISVSGTEITGSNKNLNGDLVIPEGITVIGHEAFKGSFLKSVYISSSVTDIGWSAFEYSTLREVNFAPGSQLEMIENSAFWETNLTSFNIPVSVTAISKDVSDSCDLLETITYDGTFAQWSEMEFLGDGWSGVVDEVICTDGVVSVY